MEATDSHVRVRVLKGHPVADGMASDIMGTYDLQNRRLLKSRLTYYGGATWRVVDRDDRIMELDIRNVGWYQREQIRQFVLKGVGPYWFFIASSHRPQLGLYTSTNVTLRNVHADNASGFAYKALACRNVTVENVSLKPGDNLIAGAPRDGFKVNSCSGTFSINELTRDGCNDDGMNIHSTPFEVKSVRSPTEMAVQIHNAHSWMLRYLERIPIEAGERVTVIDRSTGKRVCDGRIEEVQRVAGVLNLTLVEPVPPEVSEGMTVTIHAYTIDQFSIRNSTFRNISGNAIVFANQKARIEGCVFEHVNGKAVIAGCALHPPYYDTFEVTVPDEVAVRNSSFKNCDTYPEWHLGDPKGVISVSNGRMVTDRSVANVEILNNTFEEVAQNTSAIYIEHLANGWIEGNTYPAGSVILQNLADGNASIIIKDNQGK